MAADSQSTTNAIDPPYRFRLQSTTQWTRNLSPNPPPSIQSIAHSNFSLSMDHFKSYVQSSEKWVNCGSISVVSQIHNRVKPVPRKDHILLHRYLQVWIWSSQMLPRRLSSRNRKSANLRDEAQLRGHRRTAQGTYRDLSRWRARPSQETKGAVLGRIQSHNKQVWRIQSRLRGQPEAYSILD